jgi:ABC-type cobalt transport system substrate-binding protein
MTRRRFRDLAVSRWFETLLPPEPGTAESLTEQLRRVRQHISEGAGRWVGDDENVSDVIETVEPGWTPTVPNILTEPEPPPPPTHTPRRSRESLQILEQLRDLAADQAEIERLHAYADHWHTWWNSQLEQARQQRERTEDMRASFAAFEWRILL